MRQSVHVFAPRRSRPIRRNATLALVVSLVAPSWLGSASAVPDESRVPGARTVPDPACSDEYWFDPVPVADMVARAAGVAPPADVPAAARDAINATGPEFHGPATGGEAPPEVAATLPDVVHFRGRTETYNDATYYAARGGKIYTKPIHQAGGAWRELLLPECLDGKVTEISADDAVIIAANANREIYTWDSGWGTGPGAWTRRWGPFFWTDMGAHIPSDVSDWDTSILNSNTDEYFLDGAGRRQKPWGILTLYALRGDGRRITYLDPWLPSDESREVCGPERGTVLMAGLAGSGSTVMVITETGDVYTRLYEFDVSGGNTVLLQYAWRDQDGAAKPRIQLPAPDWIHHGPIPGATTNRISIRKVSPGTEHRIMRVEGTDAQGATGYWEKDTAKDAWNFVATGEPLRGDALPTDGPHTAASEDASYEGVVDGFAARLTGFNPYCSPTTLRIDFASGPLDLVLHSTDGLRQERRARGLDLSPRYYRSAVEVPRAVWESRDSLDPEVRAFLDRYFGDDRFIEGPLYATAASVHVWETCWVFARAPGDPTALVTQPHVVDAGTVVADSAAQGMEGRGATPSRCSSG